MQFPQPPKEDSKVLYREETDQNLPTKLDPHMRYAFFKTIARGGKSIIQACLDRHLGRTICYKSLRPELADNPVEQQRFLREARVTAMLQHPNTVPIYELGRNPRGRYYFTMKLVHGYTLREILDRRERYDLRQLVEVLAQVARALEYAHAHRVIHRDIKPENILAGPFGEVLLLDWGLAKVWDKGETGPRPPLESSARLEENDPSMTRTGKLEGTVAYMSPEQIRKDHDIDFRTDIYSLGTVLFEILTGQLPAPGKTVAEVIDSILTKEPRRPSEISGTPLPPRLERTCARCIQKNPAERIQSATELARELEDDWHDLP